MTNLTETDLTALRSWSSGNGEYTDEEIKSRFQFIFASREKAKELFVNYESRLKALEIERYLDATSLRFQEFTHRWKELYPAPDDLDRQRLHIMAASVNSYAPDSAIKRSLLLNELLVRYARYEEIERRILSEANIPFNRPEWFIARSHSGGVITVKGCRGGSAYPENATPFLFRTEVAALAFATYYGYLYSSVLGV